MKENLVELSRFLQREFKGTKYYLSAHQQDYGLVYYAVDTEGENFMFLEIGGKNVGLRRSAFDNELKFLLEKLFPRHRIRLNHYVDKKTV